jgi:hypothetical protein
MAKKTETKTETKKAAPKAAAPKKAKTEKAPAPARGPRAQVVAKHQNKEALAKALAEVVGRADEDTDLIADRLKRASNKQLIRLHAVSETVKKKFGNREKLIAAIGVSEKKAKDKDFLAKLDAMSLPALLDLATSSQRRARA